MRTNIVLDDRLVREAMKLAKARTMREAVDIALRRFVQSGRQKKLLDLYGAGGVRKDYDYKRARSGACCIWWTPRSGWNTCAGTLHRR